MDIGWVKTKDHFTVVCDGNPYTYSKKSSKYKMLMKYVQKDDREAVYNLVTSKKEKELLASKGFKVIGEKIINKNEELHPVLIDKLSSFIDERGNIGPYVKFLDNIEKNPDRASREQLLNYLKRYNCPITQDGCFLAYKYVIKLNGGKLVDSYTRTYDNSIGKIVTMDRKKCDNNPYVSCSTGLHVAAYCYANPIAGSGNVLIEVKVNPKDVVSVPVDYNCQKIRCCRYEVIRVGKKEIKKNYVRIASNKIDFSETQGSPDFESMSGKDIISYIRKRTGITIPVSPKSKKSVIRHARKALNMKKKVTTKDKIDLSGKTGQQIIDIVYEQTGYKINLSPKSKKSIIKKAWSVLTEHGIKVKV